LKDPINVNICVKSEVDATYNFLYIEANVNCGQTERYTNM